METTVRLMWIVGGIGALVAIACLLVVAWRSEREERDLGSVSNQWVSEHRLGQSSHDSQR
jgi:HAMP domain-containing protein